MTLYGRIYNKIIFPAFSITNGTNIHNIIRDMDKSQHFSREKIDELRDRRLREIIRYSYDNVLYYRKIFRELSLKPEDIRTTEDLAVLPVLTKSTIRENQKELLALDFQGKRMKYQTGGSTGEPLEFYVTGAMLSHAASARYRAWSWAGYTPGDRMFLLWGSDIDVRKHKSLSATAKRKLQRVEMFNAFSLDEDMLKNIVSLLQRKRGIFLRSYASSAELLARYVVENGNGIELGGVITTAETLMPHQRELIEKAFGCDVFDGYGSRETSLIAHECREHHGYHISEENSVVEILRDGEQVVGEEGAVIITDLHNRAMPFIRYQIEDAGTMKADMEDSCGINLRCLEKIHGRVNDIIVTPDGKYLHGEFFTHLFYEYTDTVEKFQVVQKKPDKLLIKIVPRENAILPEEKIGEIMNLLKEALGAEVSIDVSICDSIPSTSSGKHRFTISEVPVKFT